MPNLSEAKRIIEGALLASQEPLSLADLKRLFEEEIGPDILRRLLDEVEMPLVPVLVDMEWRGIAVDTAKLAVLSREFGRELRELEDAIHHEAGTDFNINSTPQLRHVLFEKLGLHPA